MWVLFYIFIPYQLQRKFRRHRICRRYCLICKINQGTISEISPPEFSTHSISLHRHRLLYRDNSREYRYEVTLSRHKSFPPIIVGITASRGNWTVSLLALSVLFQHRGNVADNHYLNMK